MILSEEALKLKQDFDDVYSAGFERGKSEGGGSLPITMGWVNSINNVRLGDLTWGGEVLELEFPTVTDLTYCFARADFNTATTHLIARFQRPIKNASEFFRRSTASGTVTPITRVTLYADFSQCTSFNYFFGTCRELRVIDGDPINCSSNANFSGMFYLCNVLEEVRFVPNTLYKSCGCTSAYLSDASVLSFIDGLVDLTGGTAQTLTFHADVKAKLTETQIATITGKNWTLA